jgi:hypothetical protein
MFQRLKELMWLLRNILIYRSGLYRTWNRITYDFPNFVKNVWRFRKALSQFHWWDRHGIYVFMHKSIEIMSDNTEKYGIEVDISRLKKVAKMKRAAELLKNSIDENFIEQAETELGELIMNPIEFVPSKSRPDCYEMVDNDTPEERAHNKKVFNRAREIEAEQWIELMEILKGQDVKGYNPDTKDWDDWYDGSGLQNWWD